MTCRLGVKSNTTEIGEDVMLGRARPTVFLITIDVEGDNLWARPKQITTRNAALLPRFQALCEAYGLKPTYLTNYEMAQSPAFVEFGRDVLRREAGEIGMHLHAWNSPPEYALTTNDLRYQPYLTEYPRPVMRDKIVAMTALLEDTFGVKVVSHRAGRWGFNEVYAQLLVEQGYLVDCSVTPHKSWRIFRGDPKGVGGPDFTDFPTDAYFLDLTDIRRPGTSPLLELPVTIVPSRSAWRRWVGRRLKNSWLGLVVNRFFPIVHWLSPNGRNRNTMLRLVREGVQRGANYLEFVLHSSELMPGGSFLFPTARHIERLYADLEALFALAGELCRGMTLSEYRKLCSPSGGVE